MAKILIALALWLFPQAYRMHNSLSYGLNHSLSSWNVDALNISPIKGWFAQQASGRLKNYADIYATAYPNRGLVRLQRLSHEAYLLYNIYNPENLSYTEQKKWGASLNTLFRLASHYYAQATTVQEFKQALYWYKEITGYKSQKCPSYFYSTSIMADLNIFPYFPGMAECYYKIGWIYKLGLAGKQKPLKALKWFIKATEEKYQWKAGVYWITLAAMGYDEEEPDLSYRCFEKGILYNPELLYLFSTLLAPQDALQAVENTTALEQAIKDGATLSQPDPQVIAQAYEVFTHYLNQGEEAENQLLQLINDWIEKIYWCKNPTQIMNELKEKESLSQALDKALDEASGETPDETLDEAPGESPSQKEHQKA